MTMKANHKGETFSLPLQARPQWKVFFILVETLHFLVSCLIFLSPLLDANNTDICGKDFFSHNTAWPWNSSPAECFDSLIL